MTFHGKFGGAPLTWKKNGIITTENFGGEGVQIVFDSGQDGTQSTATGLDYYPIAQIGKPETWNYSYFGYETVAGVYSGKAVYETTSFLPYFWVSLDAIDDAIPNDPRGDHRWSTRYHDILGLSSKAYETFGAPIYFSGNASVPSGIILLGDEIKPIYAPGTPWYERVNRIPGGRFALRTRVSMRYAGYDAIAGIMLRKNLTLSSQADVHSVYAAPGQQLNINRWGVVQLVDRGKIVWTSPSQYWATHKRSLETDLGLQIEIRTHNWGTERMELYFDGKFEGGVTTVPQGEAFGLFGSSTTGPIKFSDRQFIDVGTQCLSRWETTPEGTMLGTLSVYRIASPWSVPMYRVNLPVAFVNRNFRQTHRVWDHNWNSYGFTELSRMFPEGWIPYAAPGWSARAMWSGSLDGAYGVWIKPKRLPSVGQFIIAPFVQAHSSLPYGANFNPVPFTSESMTVEVAPNIRWDLSK